ncbi:MAG: hypothetical protein NC911_04255 [Candidatus Omnitrophica bacterium]|nr:hypothetical protein [Candidatus Omnitrophota bacterium]
MKKFMAFTFLVLLLGIARGEVTSYSEVEETIKLLHQAIKTGQEEMVPIYEAALELVKKATVPMRAEGIIRRLRQENRLSSTEFKKLRERFLLVDLLLAHAVSRQTGEKFFQVIAWREKNTWPEIFREKSINPECSKYILELSPVEIPGSHTPQKSIPQGNR